MYFIWSIRFIIAKTEDHGVKLRSAKTDDHCVRLRYTKSVFTDNTKCTDEFYHLPSHVILHHETFLGGNLYFSN